MATEIGTTEIDTTAVILDLLTKAAAAHGIHEAEDLGGVRDEQWPEWYTAHMVRGLGEAGYRIVRVE